MTEIIFIEANGNRYNVDAVNGETLMEAALNSGLEGIVADCGGACSCATCHCIIADEWLEKAGGPDEIENHMLAFTAVERQAGSRLSCQITVSDELEGLVVRLPKTQY